jgi:hypothetical protein
MVAWMIVNELLEGFASMQSAHLPSSFPSELEIITWPFSCGLVCLSMLQMHAIVSFTNVNSFMFEFTFLITCLNLGTLILQS